VQVGEVKPGAGGPVVEPGDDPDLDAPPRELAGRRQPPGLQARDDGAIFRNRCSDRAAQSMPSPVSPRSRIDLAGTFVVLTQGTV
jgi:hypothetical protein